MTIEFAPFFVVLSSDLNGNTPEVESRMHHVDVESVYIGSPQEVECAKRVDCQNSSHVVKM